MLYVYDMRLVDVKDTEYVQSFHISFPFFLSTYMIAFWRI